MNIMLLLSNLLNFLFPSKSDLLKDIPTLDATAGSLGSPFKRPGNNMPAVSKVSIVRKPTNKTNISFNYFSFIYQI